jgi:eukaryotic-like serine/threonine-protein kinase
MTVERLRASLAERYHIERELGAGGMATVYLAEDLKHKRKVALKVLKPELAAVLGADRFVQEITTTAQLQHPHILPLFDSGQADGFLFYVMPFIDGETLRDKLNRETQLGIEEAVKITTEVADALDYAHRHGVVHRDIKPENILLHDGRPMVADFGIALALSAAAGGRMTETGLSLGTPYYMSPEQATAEKEITARSDVYSLGSVLYEMLTGNPPHSGGSAQQIIMKIVTEEAAPVTKMRKAVPPNVAAAVAKSLEKLPADRFESAAAFAAALGDPTFHTVESPGTGGGGALHGPARRALVAMAALAALFLVAALWGWLRPTAPDARPLHVELEPPLGTEYAEFRFAALAPDGRRLAFIGLGSAGRRQIWMRDLETGRIDSLPQTDGAEGPFWSPDGAAIGFVAGGALMRLSLGSRVPRQLCPAADVGGSWSGQGVILFTNRGHPMTVDASGGPCTPVAGAWSDSTLTIVRPTWFPDGRHFAGGQGAVIVRSNVDGESPQTFIPAATDIQFVAPNFAVYARSAPVGGVGGSDVVAQRFVAGSPALRGVAVTLAQGVRSASGVPSFAVAANALAFLSVPQENPGFLIVDASGRILDSIASSGSWTLRVAWNGSAVALGGAALWTYDLARRTTTAITPSPTTIVFPVWSPGDSLLAATVSCRIVMIRLASGSDTTLIDQSMQGRCYEPTDWTSDGAFLVLAGAGIGGTRGGRLWTLDVRTGTLEPLVSVAGTASAGAVSPDRQWLAYVSDETGELQVYVRPFRRSGAAVRLSTSGGALPRWRRDGRALYYVTPNGGIEHVAVAAGASLQLGVPEVLFRVPRWSGRLFADQQGGRQLTTLYDVSRDGTRFLVRPRTEESPAATLVLNWQSLLRGSAQPAGDRAP